MDVQTEEFEIFEEIVLPDHDFDPPPSDSSGNRFQLVLEEQGVYKSSSEREAPLGDRRCVKGSFPGSHRRRNRRFREERKTLDVFKCKYCSRKFLTAWHCGKHMKVAHIGNTEGLKELLHHNLRCTACQKIFGSYHVLRSHLRSHKDLGKAEIDIELISRKNCKSVNGNYITKYRKLRQVRREFMERFRSVIQKYQMSNNVSVSPKKIIQKELPDFYQMCFICRTHVGKGLDLLIQHFEENHNAGADKLCKFFPSVFKTDI